MFSGVGYIRNLTALGSKSVKEKYLSRKKMKLSMQVGFGETGLGRGSSVFQEGGGGSKFLPGTLLPREMGDEDPLGQSCTQPHHRAPSGQGLALGLGFLGRVGRWERGVEAQAIPVEGHCMDPSSDSV